jgi:aspartyl protease family protein
LRIVEYLEKSNLELIMMNGKKTGGHLGMAVPLLFLLLILGALFPVGAVERLRVMALFPGKVMVDVDGRNRLLRVGTPSPEGVLLISATARGAEIEVDGQRRSYTLGSHVGGSFETPELQEVQIWRDARGAYHTRGSINGHSTDMLVDTGATSVAMSETEAKRLGIRYQEQGRPIGVNTASGFARAYSVVLDQVRVGEIELSRVEAVVIEGSAPREVLLGMSFLKQVEMQNKGEMLLLRSKY